MSATKVLIIDTIHPVFNHLINQAGIECGDGTHLSKDEILESINEYDGIQIRSRFKIDKDFLEKCNRLKFIARAGAGMENIDVRVASEKGIACINAPEGNRDAVGEHAIGMLLMLFNHLKRADAEVRQGIWKREENRGIELQGKTIGIIGFGNMGSAFAEKLRGFGVQILAYDKYIAISQTVFPFVIQTSLEKIFKETDILSLHVPLTAETNYLVNDHFLQQFKKPIYLINTSRGKVVETNALVNQIKAGRVIGACLDVLEYESISFEQLAHANMPEAFQYLVQSEKVILSPHIGGWTHESNEKIARVLAEKIIQVLKK